MSARSFRTSQVCKIVGITYRQLDYWARTDLVRPSISETGESGTQRLYSYSDLVQLKVIKRLLDAGMSLKRIRVAIGVLRDQLSSGKELANVTLLSDGISLFAAESAEEVVDVFRRGQGVFGIAVGAVESELQDFLAEAEPPQGVPGFLSVRLPEESVRFIEQLASRLHERLTRTEERWRVVGESLSSMGDPDELVDRMMAELPPPSEWDERMGPFYSTATLSERLGNVRLSDLEEFRRDGRLLGLMTIDGVWVYPTWQLRDDGTILSGLQDVLQPFVGRGIDGWEIAGWLLSTMKSLGGTSPLEYLRTTGSAGPLTQLAKDAAIRLAA